MGELPYTIKEIIDIQLRGIDHKLDDIKTALKEQNVYTTNRFAHLEVEMDGFRKEIAKLRDEQTKYRIIWGVGATIGSSFVATVVAFSFYRLF